MSGNRVFVGRLTGLREQTIRNYFRKFDTDLRLLLNAERGFAYVTFSNSAIAEKILLQDHFIENRKVNVKRFKQDEEKPTEIDSVPVFTEAFLQSLPVDSSLLYGEFLDFFYKPILVEPVKLVIISKGADAKPVGFGFLNSRENVGLQNGRVWSLLKCELARLVEIIRQSHSDCQRGCQLRGTKFGNAMGFPTETLTDRLPNFPDASRYYRPLRSRVTLEYVPSLPVPPHDSERFFEGYEEAATYNFVLIDQDRVRGLCGFGVVPINFQGGAEYPTQMIPTVQNILTIICTGLRQQAAAV